MLVTHELVVEKRLGHNSSNLIEVQTIILLALKIYGVSCWRGKEAIEKVGVFILIVSKNAHPESTPLSTGECQASPGQALYSLADLFLPAGVYVYSGCSVS